METPHRTEGSAAEPPPLTDSDASLLVGLIDGLTTAARQGESPDVEALAGEHPRLADELRSLWAMIWVTESLAAPRSQDGRRGIRRSSFPRQTRRLIGPHPPRVPFSSAIISSSKS